MEVGYFVKGINTITNQARDEKCDAEAQVKKKKKYIKFRAAGRGGRVPYHEFEMQARLPICSHQ